MIPETILIFWRLFFPSLPPALFPLSFFKGGFVNTESGTEIMEMGFFILSLSPVLPSHLRVNLARTPAFT